jgi:hypothetical protein
MKVSILYRSALPRYVSVLNHRESGKNHFFRVFFELQRKRSSAMKTATITYLPKSVKFRKILLQVVKNTSTMTMIFLKLSSISLRINPSMLHLVNRAIQQGMFYIMARDCYHRENGKNSHHWENTCSGVTSDFGTSVSNFL